MSVTETIIDLKYTVCFVISSQRVLMVYRRRKPNQNQWNGLGGKILPGENAVSNVRREILEEAGIDLTEVQNLQFAGVATWNIDEDWCPISERVGMYVFIARLPVGEFIHESRDTSEGILDWKEVNWACDAASRDVVSNIAIYFPPMVNGEPAREYRFEYEGRQIERYVVLPLSEWMSSESLVHRERSDYD